MRSRASGSTRSGRRCKRGRNRVAGRYLGRSGTRAAACSRWRRANPPTTSGERSPRRCSPGNPRHAGGARSTVHACSTSRGSSTSCPTPSPLLPHLGKSHTQTWKRWSRSQSVGSYVGEWGDRLRGGDRGLSPQRPIASVAQSCANEMECPVELVLKFDLAARASPRRLARRAPSWPIRERSRQASLLLPESKWLQAPQS